MFGVAIRTPAESPRVPDPPAEGAAEGFPQRKPLNLKVLPQDITPLALEKLMKGYQADLGVKCGHCHAEDPGTHKLDYASDQNSAKSNARLMITMLKDINEKYLPQMDDDVRYAVPVTCGTCHQGQSSPPEYEPR